MFRLQQFLRWIVRTGFPLVSVGLHLVVVVAYARRWDRVAAVTVFPFWAWGVLGGGVALASWIFFRTRLGLGVGGVWLATILIGSDETRPLLRMGAQKPLTGLPADHAGKRLLRVVSLNCKKNPVSAEEIIPWKPDFVLLQEAPSSQALVNLSNKLYPDGKPGTHFFGGIECAVMTRGTIKNPAPLMGWRFIPCFVELDGVRFNVVSVHLQGAVTDMGLHRFSTWERHYLNRLSRREDMRNARSWLKTYNTASSIDVGQPPNAPTPSIIGGDFNAPAGDAVFRELEPEFTNAFDAVGSGWGNTFPNHSPMLRIDHVYANDQLKPIRAMTVETVNSDHRMVVVDYQLVLP